MTAQDDDFPFGTGRPRRALRPLCLLACLVVVSGCRSFGPDRLTADRFDYNAAISDSWSTQTLLNIVKLRYADWPSFLDVEQIVAQYTWEHSGTAKGIMRFPFTSANNQQIEGGYVGKYSERPVILYKPLRGAKYMRSMLAPAPIGALLGLVYTGWPADRMLGIMVHSVNGRRNTQIEQGYELRAQPSFALFLRTLREFQRQDALTIDVVSTGGGEDEAPIVETKLGFRVERANESMLANLAEMKAGLGLSTETNVYPVIWGAVPPNDRTIAMETRSVLQVMVALAADVEVPQSDVDEGRVVKLQPRPKEDLAGMVPLMAIRRGDSAPADAYVSCRYRDTAFWIDDTDANSKVTFTYLSLLLTLGDVDEKGGTPLVITTN